MDKITLYSHYNNETPEDAAAVGIYAHGELENDLKFDVLLVRLDTKTETIPSLAEDGIYDVVVKDNEKEIEAKLYFWQNLDCGSLRFRGLAVYPEDEEALAYAKTQFANKAKFL